jgi:hypothetical protein
MSSLSNKELELIILLIAGVLFIITYLLSRDKEVVG